MAELKRHTLHINRKGLDGLVTEDDARAFANRLGSRRMMLVEVRADSKTVDAEGNENTALVIDAGELIPDELEDNARSLQRALYMQRPEHFGDAPLPGTSGGEQSVDDAAKALDAQIERDDDGKVTGIWEGAGKAKKRAAKKTTAKKTVAAPDGSPQCEYPGCILAPHEEGDHDVPEGVTT